MIQGLVSTFLFRIPLSYYFSQRPDANMYMMGIPIPISALVALIMCIVYFIILHFAHVKKNKKNVDKVNMIEENSNNTDEANQDIIKDEKEPVVEVVCSEQANE